MRFLFVLLFLGRSSVGVSRLLIMIGIFISRSLARCRVSAESKIYDIGEEGRWRGMGEVR